MIGPSLLVLHFIGLTLFTLYVEERTEDGDHGKLVEKHRDFQGPDVEHGGLEELDRVYGACARLSRRFQLTTLCSYQIREYYSRVRSMVNILYFRNILSLKKLPGGTRVFSSKPRVLEVDSRVS